MFHQVFKNFLHKFVLIINLYPVRSHDEGLLTVNPDQIRLIRVNLDYPEMRSWGSNYQFMPIQSKGVEALKEIDKYLQESSK